MEPRRYQYQEGAINQLPKAEQPGSNQQPRPSRIQAGRFAKEREPEERNRNQPQANQVLPYRSQAQNTGFFPVGIAEK